MKQNLVVLLADIFNLFEIHPAHCVDYPESEVASGKFMNQFILFLYIVNSMLLFASVYFISISRNLNMFVCMEMQKCNNGWS